MCVPQRVGCNWPTATAQPLFSPSLSFALALPSILTPSGTTEREAEAEAAAGVSDVIGRQRRAKLRGRKQQQQEGQEDEHRRSQSDQ